MFQHYFSFHLNSLVVCGLVLLFGLMGGELANRTRFLPRLIGFIAVGFLFGPGGCNLINSTILNQTQLFIDVSLSLILFELGRYLDLRWLQRDYGLLLSGLTEASLTFLFVFFMLFFGLRFNGIIAALGATIAIATAPSVVMMIANDISSKGPVTRRTLILTSFNNFISLILFTFLLPIAQSSSNDWGLIFFFKAVFTTIGTLILGLSIFSFTKQIARLIGKHLENQFVLLLGAIILTIGLAHSFHLSSMLALFTFGAAVRNFDDKQDLMEIDLGWLSRLFYIILFVVTGIHLRLEGIWQATSAVMLFILIRSFAKFFGIMLFAKTSRITYKQGIGISLAMSPMAGLAIGMSNVLLTVSPEFNNFLLILTATVAVLSIVTPIVTQFAFSKLGEAKITTQGVL